MRSDFLGRTVQSSTVAPKASAKKFQVQAFFKKAEKKGKQVQQSAKAKLPSATQVVKKAQKSVQKAAPAAPKKQTQAPKKAAQNVFQGAKKQAKKANVQGKQAGGNISKGWFGEERASGLDRWYGKSPNHHCFVSPISRRTTRPQLRFAGPSRALFLPRGLLDEDEIPGYLNGQLAGE